MITMENIKKCYTGKEGNTIAFSCQSLTLADGEVIGLFGVNGAGKTTMLKSIMGFCRVEGEIRIDGEPVHRQYHKVSFITEEGSFLPFLTPRRYGEFQADFWPKFDLERYHRLLEFFEIEGDRQLISELSNGQQAKIEAAAGFSRGAQYILMDEPFLGKDIFTRRDFLKLMAGSLHGEETILIATHQLDEIEHFLDRALILNKGEIAADFTIDSLRQSGQTLVGAMQATIGYDPQRFQSFL